MSAFTERIIKAEAATSTATGLMIDPIMLLNVIHYIVKRVPILVPMICSFKVFATVEKVFIDQ